MQIKTVPIERIAELVNPVVRGWFYYFSKSAPDVAKSIEIINAELNSHVTPEMAKLAAESLNGLLAKEKAPRSRRVKSKRIKLYR